MRLVTHSLAVLLPRFPSHHHHHVIQQIDATVFEQTLSSLEEWQATIASVQGSSKDPLPSAAKKWWRLTSAAITCYCHHRLGKVEQAMKAADSFHRCIQKKKFQLTMGMTSHDTLSLPPPLRSNNSLSFFRSLLKYF